MKAEMVQQALDARGLSCPLPLLKLKQRLRDMACGERIEVTTTDPGSVRDLQAFAHKAREVAIQEELKFFLLATPARNLHVDCKIFWRTFF